MSTSRLNERRESIIDAENDGSAPSSKRNANAADSAAGGGSDSITDDPDANGQEQAPLLQQTSLAPPTRPPANRRRETARSNRTASGLAQPVASSIPGTGFLPGIIGSEAASQEFPGNMDILQPLPISSISQQARRSMTPASILQRLGNASPALPPSKSPSKVSAAADVFTADLFGFDSIQPPNKYKAETADENTRSSSPSGSLSENINNNNDDDIAGKRGRNRRSRRSKNENSLDSDLDRSTIKSPERNAAKARSARWLYLLATSLPAFERQAQARESASGISNYLRQKHVYRIYGDIRNLIVHVSVKRKTPESDVISKSIRWQEKIFSQSELDQLVRRKQRKIKSSGGPKAVTADMERIFTQRVGNPSSIEARYMSDRLLGSDSKSFQLYTLIDSQDGHLELQKEQEGRGELSNESLVSSDDITVTVEGATSNPLISHLSDEKNQHRRLFFSTERDQISSLAGKELTYQGSKRARWDRPFHDFSIIYEAIGGSSSEKYTLCRMRYYGSGWLEMSPGFSHNHHYHQKRPKSDETLFEFIISNGTGKLPKDQAEELSLFQQDQYERQLLLRQEFVGNLFKIPPAAGTRLTVMGQVKGAHGFDTTDAIWLEFTLQIPNDGNWILESNNGKAASYGGGDPISLGKTMRCLGISQENATTGYTYYTFNLSHQFEMEFVQLGGSADLDQVPKLYFTVFSCEADGLASLTSWSRQKTIGYGWMNLPNGAGRYEYELSCWQPSLSTEQKLSAKYTVDDIRLRDLSYVSDPRIQASSQQIPDMMTMNATTNQNIDNFINFGSGTGSTSQLSKYGFMSQGSGVVELEFDVFSQVAGVGSHSRAARNKWFTKSFHSGKVTKGGAGTLSATPSTVTSRAASPSRGVSGIKEIKDVLARAKARVRRSETNSPT